MTPRTITVLASAAALSAALTACGGSSKPVTAKSETSALCKQVAAMQKDLNETNGNRSTDMLNTSINALGDAAKLANFNMTATENAIDTVAGNLANNWDHWSATKDADQLSIAEADCRIPMNS